MFKWTNRFADVFIISINPEKEEIEYDVRDKETGKSIEVRKISKFTINEPGGLVHFDMREMPIDLFQYVYSIL